MKKYFGIILCFVTAVLMGAAGHYVWDDREKRTWVQGNREESEGNLYRCNLRLCREKGLLGVLEEENKDSRYLRLRAVYRANLEAYLMDVLDVRALDDKLKNSRHGFRSRGLEERNRYERESSMGLEFICLRNNLYIEYLSKEQLRLLEHQTEKGETWVSDSVKEMVKATYRDIIRVRDPQNWDDESRFLYPAAQGRKPVIPNQALVLSISDAVEYDEAGNLLVDGHREEKYKYLDELKKEKEKEYSQILGVEVYILVE